MHVPVCILIISALLHCSSSPTDPVSRSISVVAAPHGFPLSVLGLKEECATDRRIDDLDQIPSSQNKWWADKPHTSTSAESHPESMPESHPVALGHSTDQPTICQFLRGQEAGAFSVPQPPSEPTPPQTPRPAARSTRYDADPLSEEVLNKIENSGRRHNHAYNSTSYLPIDHNRWFYWWVEKKLMAKQKTVTVRNAEKCICAAKKDGVLTPGFEQWLKTIKNKTLLAYIYLKIKNVRRQLLGSEAQSVPP